MMFGRAKWFYEQLRDLYEMRFELQEERIKILEGRIQNLDGWIQTVAATKGLGVPAESTVGEYEEELSALDFDPEDDMTLQGMWQPWEPELRSEEEEATEEVSDAS